MCSTKMFGAEWGGGSGGDMSVASGEAAAVNNTPPTSAANRSRSPTRPTPPSSSPSAAIPPHQPQSVAAVTRSVPAHGVYHTDAGRGSDGAGDIRDAALEQGQAPTRLVLEEGKKKEKKVGDAQEAPYGNDIPAGSLEDDLPRPLTLTPSSLPSSPRVMRGSRLSREPPPAEPSPTPVNSPSARVVSFSRHIHGKIGGSDDDGGNRTELSYRRTQRTTPRENSPLCRFSLAPRECVVS